MKYFETKKEYEDYSAEGLVSGDVCYVVENKSAHFRTNNIDGTNKTYDVGGSESGDVVLVTKNITENGSYTPEDADGYSSVNVNVPIPEGYINPEGTVEITSNGTTNVRNFNSATVNVQPDLVEETFTQNGVYLPSPADGYSKVTVNVHQNELIEATFTENGSYTPANADGYSTVNVNVPIPEGYIKPTGDINISANGTVNVNDYKMAVVNVPIPEGYIKPSGTKDIYENGNNIDVNNYKAVNVNVPQPSGRIEITENGDNIDIANYALANVNVPIPEGYIKPTGNLNVTSNGSVNVKTYETATVNVQPDLVQGNITTNGTHTPANHDGYSSVTVNVQPDLTTETITENGTYEPENADGYSEVTVNVQPDLVQGNITTNGTHTPTNHDGYSSVTVNVQPDLTTESITSNGTYTPTGYDGYSEVTVDVQPDLTTETITENGTYTPTGYDGYSQVTVNVSGGQDAIDLLERKISSYTIPNGTTRLGTGALSYFKGLQSVTIPDSVTSVGNNAFTYCSKLDNIVLSDNILKVGSATFSYCSLLTHVTFGSSITNIGYNPFDDCSQIALICKATTPPTLGQWASTSAKGSRIYVPDASVDTYKAASNWSTWSSYIYPMSQYPRTISYMAPAKQDENSGAGGVRTTAFFGENDTQLTTTTHSWYQSEYGGRLLFNGDIKTIGDGAFYSATITKITIPEGVTNIEGAFYKCTKLTTLALPDSVISIGDSAFEQCSALTEISIPNSVTSIGGTAFSRCTALTEIVIPESVTNIGSGAFGSCTALTSVIVKATTPPTLGSNAFNYNASGRKIYVPAASVNAYKTATNWSTYKSYIYPMSQLV